MVDFLEKFRKNPQNSVDFVWEILLGRGSIMRPGHEHQQAPRQARSRAEVLGEAMTDGGHSQLRCRRRCMSRSMPPPGQGRAATTILLPAFRWNMEGIDTGKDLIHLIFIPLCI
jgi:hypothetical protein